MKKIVLVFALFFPLLLCAQDFSESFDKTQTLAWINKSIKPTGNTCNLRSLKTNATYTENFFDKNGVASYTFDLAKVKFAINGNKVRVSCTTGNCIKYTYKESGKEEVKELNYLDLEAKGTTASQLQRALTHLLKTVGL